MHCARHANGGFMSVNTKNVYGQISISDEAIAAVAAHTARECYGVMETVSRRLTDYIAEIFQRSRRSRGVKVETLGDRIYIDLFVVLKYGVSISAVSETLREQVKYNVEKFAGMIVDTINVIVCGIEL